MWNAEGISERLLEGWESGKTEDGMPFYTNHKTRKTQWDHPLLVKTMEELVDMDTIKYAAYRTAMKLRFLQKRLQLDLVELPNLTSVFDRHGFGMHCNQYIHCDELHKIVCDIFKVCRKISTGTVYNNMNIETSAELLLNFLLNLNDRKRTGKIRVVGVKVTLAALCCGRLAEKYRFFFRHICDRTQHVTRKAMGSLLKDLIQIPDLMNESGSFGGLNIAPAVDNCFGTSWSSHGITEDELLTWLLREPQTVVWLPTMHRMAAAEGVKHDAKCSICKALPIIGFRYRCLKCFNYDLCQMCFFTGRTSKNHKTKHPTQEYCLTTSTKEDTKALLRTVRNNFSRKHRNKRKLRYLPIDGTQQPYDPEEFEEELSDTTPEESPEIEKKVSRPSSRALKAEIERDEVDHHIINDWNMHEPDRLYQPPQNELNSIIYHLEDENRELMHEIERLHLSSPPSHSEAGSSHSSEADWLRDERDRLAAKQEVLESHNKQLELQLKRLRAIVKSGVHVPTARQPLSNISQNVPSHIPTSYPSNSQKSSTPHQQTYQLQPQSNHDNSQLTPDRLQSQDVTLSHTPASQHHESQLQFDTPESLRIDDLTMGSLEDTLGQTHFSLPDPDHTVNYPEEEAKLSELMAKLDKAYPLDTSLAATPGGNSAMEEMFRAANQIGDAFAEFVKPGALNDESAA